MLMKKVFLIFITIISYALITFSCAQENESLLASPKIKAGTIKISGKITGTNSINKGNYPDLTLYVPYPVTIKAGRFKTQPDNSGNFYFEVPAECDTNLVYLYSKLFKEKDLFMDLRSGEELKIEIDCDDNGIKKVNAKTDSGPVSFDIVEFSRIVGKFIQPRLAEHYVKCYDLNHEEYSRLEMEIMEKRIDYAIKNEKLSERMKSYISNEGRLFFLSGTFLNYSDYVKLNYRKFKTVEETKLFCSERTK